jgi:hypothetical protein
MTSPIQTRMQSVLPPKPQKLLKKSQKRPKIVHFSNTFDNIYQAETLKLGY